MRQQQVGARFLRQTIRGLRLRGQRPSLGGPSLAGPSVWNSASSGICLELALAGRPLGISRIGGRETTAAQMRRPD